MISKLKKSTCAHGVCGKTCGDAKIASLAIIAAERYPKVLLQANRLATDQP